MELSNKPTEDTLNDVLGSVYSHYEEIIAITGTFSTEWIHSQSGGWMLKVFDNKKSLLYIIPLRKEFIVSLAIRENEKDNILNDAKLKELHRQVSTSKKHTEGYALKYEIANDQEYRQARLLIEKLIEFRK